MLTYFAYAQLSSASQTVDDNRENGGAILSAEEVQCWSSVKEDPSDFQSWIKLLQLVEQKASPPPPSGMATISLHHGATLLLCRT